MSAAKHSDGISVAGGGKAELFVVGRQPHQAIVQVSIAVSIAAITRHPYYTRDRLAGTGSGSLAMQ